MASPAAIIYLANHIMGGGVTDQGFGFVQRELDKIAVALRADGVAPECYGRLYAAQQALSWALEPSGFKTRSTGLWALRERQQVVRLVPVRLCLEVFVAVLAPRDDDPHLVVIDGHVEAPLVVLDSPNRLGLAEFPSRPVCVRSTDGQDALMRVVAV